MKMVPLGMTIPLLPKKPPKIVQIPMPYKPLCGIPNEKMKFLEPLRFAELERIIQAQVSIHEPIFDSVEGSIDWIVLAGVAGISFQRVLCF